MAIHPELTDEQRANLKTLAAYLRTLPEDYSDFDMSDYAQDEYSNAHKIDCGTVACAIGHGPVAGIKSKVDEDWVDYADRVFGEDISIYHWCFNAFWKRIDNTADGAAARIEWMLEHGIPADYYEQALGSSPLCYTPGAL